MTPTEARDHILSGHTKAIHVDRSIDLSGTDLKNINCSIACNDLDLSGTQIESLPAKVKVRSRLTMDNCKSLELLPAGLTCGSLSLRGSTFIERLPERLDTWFLNASDCSR